MTDETPQQQTDAEEQAAESATATQEPPADETTPADVPNRPLFEEDELEQFDADDVTAGSAICKMLSLFFLYTVIVMAIVGFWTASVVLE